MINFEDGVLVTPAKVNEDGTITPAQYSGKTPLSAYNLNRMQKLTECITGKSISTTTIEGACKIKKVHGDLQQETSTQGKNICPTDISYWESGHYATNGVKENSPARIRLKKLLKVEPNTTYYLSTNSSDYPFVVRSYDSTGKFLASVGAVQTNTTITTASDVKYLSIALYKSGANMNDQTFENYRTYFANGTLKPFICLNSVADKTYEEFSPDSPSPDYPSEIEVVGDNINLFDKNDVTDGMFINRLDGTENTTSSASNYSTSGFCEVKSNTDYYVGISYSSNYYGVVFYDNSKNYLSGEQLANKFTTPDNCCYVRFSWITANYDKNKIKLEKGTVATGYTSYGIGGIDYKVVGKNLIGVKDTSSHTNLGLTIEYDSSTGEYKLNGTSTNSGYIKLYDDLEVCTYTNLNTKNRTLISKGDYTLSYKYISGSKTTGSANIMIRDCDSNISLPKYEISKIETQNKQIQFTVSEDYLTQKYIWFASDITFTNFKFSIQLERGSVLTEHKSYKEKDVVIELPQGEFMAKIGDVQDYIDNKGILHKYIKKIILTGEEAWATNMNAGWTENKHVFGITNYEIETNGQSTDTGIVLASSHYKATNTSVLVFSKNDCISYYPANSRIVINNQSTDNLTDFKAWLVEQYNNGTPVTIYYVLATPYEVNFKYNNILPQYEEMTNISCSAKTEIEFANSPVIASVNETFDKIQNDNDLETTIMIGDSYGEGANATTNWCDILKRLLNLSDNEYYKFAKGGAGFKAVAPNGQNFIKLLQDNINSITNKTAVKNIIVCGGYNDITETYETITEKIEEFCDYCKYNFPNAKVYCGMIGNNSLIDNVDEYTYSNVRQKLNDTITPAYQTINKYGGIYLNGVETCLKDYSFMGSDNYHPNDAGQNSIAQLVYQCLKIGNGYIYTNIDNAQLYEAGNGYITNYQVKIYHSGGNTKISIPNIHHTFTAPVSPIDSIDFRLFGIDSKLLRNQYMVNIPIMCLVNDTIHLHGKLYLSMDNKIILRVNKDKPEQINKIIIYPEEYIIPTKYC